MSVRGVRSRRQQSANYRLCAHRARRLSDSPSAAATLGPPPAAAAGHFIWRRRSASSFSRSPAADENAPGTAAVAAAAAACRFGAAWIIRKLAIIGAEVLRRCTFRTSPVRRPLQAYIGGQCVLLVVLPALGSPSRRGVTGLVAGHEAGGNFLAQVPAYRCAWLAARCGRQVASARGVHRGRYIVVGTSSTCYF